MYTPPSPSPDQQPITPDQQICQQHLDDVIRRLRGDAQCIGEITQAAAGLLPPDPPQAEAIDQEVGRHPSHQNRRQSIGLGDEADGSDGQFGHRRQQHHVAEGQSSDWVRHHEEFHIPKRSPQLGQPGQPKDHACGDREPLEPHGT